MPRDRQKWQGYVDDPVSGRRSTRTFDRQADARAWVDDRKREVAAAAGDPRDRPLSIVGFYEQHHAAWGHGPRTAPEVATFVRVYVEPRWGGVPVQHWDRHDFDAWVERLQGRQGGPRAGDRLPDPRTGRLGTIGAARAQTLVAHVKAMANRALDLDLIRENPIARAKRPKVEVGQIEEIISEEAFLAACEHLPDWCRDAVYGLAYTGLRLGELNALHDASEILGAGDSRFLSIRSTVDENDRCRFSWKPYTKSKTNRVIPYPDHVRERWGAFEPSRRRPGLLLPVGTEPAAPPHALGSWFRSPNGTAPICRHTLGDAWKAALRASDVDPKWQIRDLRHLCASMLLADGNSIEEVGVHLGHRIGSSQTKVYLHMMKGYRERARRSLDRPLRLLRHDEGAA